MKTEPCPGGQLEPIVGRLRDLAGYLWHEGQPGHDVAREAADEIERLQADAERYRWWRSKQHSHSPQMDSTFAYSTVGRLPLRGRTFDEAVDAAMQQDKPPNAAAQADCSHDLLPVSRTHSRCMNCDALVLTPNAVLSGCPPTTDQNSGGPSGQSA